LRYGVSTHLYHARPLTRAHLEELRAFGFEAVEIFATRSHVDYHDPAVLDTLALWLGDLNLSLHGIHAPIMEGFGRGDRWEGRIFSLAASDTARRRDAVREASQALEIARRVPMQVLVVHLGVPRGPQVTAGDNARDAALRSLEELHAVATPLGVRLAVEVIPNELSTVDTLVQLIEEDLPLAGTGICMDFGHAHLLGDVVEAVEAASGHLISTHVHDNDGRSDGHLVPFEGGIDWAGTLMALQKIGYEGTMLFEVADTSSPRDVLDKTRRARARFDQMMA
jgi:sugar phosphate isomerase/epimerase